MSNPISRWLNRNKPFVCKLCGLSIPIIGTRQDQASFAVDHMEDEHHDYYFYGAPNELGASDD